MRLFVEASKPPSYADTKSLSHIQSDARSHGVTTHARHGSLVSEKDAHCIPKTSVGCPRIQYLRGKNGNCQIRELDSIYNIKISVKTVKLTVGP